LGKTAAVARIVMPTQLGIHAFAGPDPDRRGWRAFARHDGALAAPTAIVRTAEPSDGFDINA
jgi:hypothetical protein